MTAKFLLPLALAASSTATVLPREAGSDALSKGWLSFPITHSRTTAPLVRRDSDVPLYNVTSVSYLIQLSLGTPGQSVKVAIDTGSDELWVNPDCRGTGLTTDQRNECLADGKYTPSSSSTAKTYSTKSFIQYGKGSVNLTYVSDTISLPDSTLAVTGARFGVASASKELNEGILGLGWGNGYNLEYNNLVDELYAQKLISSKVFSIALGSVEANNGGTLVFGGVDTKKFSGSLVSNPILPPQGKDVLHRYWIQMTAVSLTRSGSTKAYSGGNMPVVIDSGSSLSYLPSTIVKAMATDFSGTLDSQSGLYLVPCTQATQTGTVDFAFGQVTIRVPFSEFIWRYSSRTCVLGAVPVDPRSGITALLGDTFMRSAFVVFDQSQSTISMAQYASCGANEQLIASGGTASFKGECAAGAGLGSGSSGATGTGSGSGTGGGSGSGSGSGPSGAAGRVGLSSAALAVALLGTVLVGVL